MYKSYYKKNKMKKKNRKKYWIKLKEHLLEAWPGSTLCNVYTFRMCNTRIQRIVYVLKVLSMVLVSYFNFIVHTAIP